VHDLDPDFSILRPFAFVGAAAFALGFLGWLAFCLH
jgi:hypothetical protein